jgi:hypothetical protein
MAAEYAGALRGALKDDTTDDGTAVPDAQVP